MDAIDELGRLASVLRIEQREDFALHDAWLKQSSISERKRNGITWFPLRIVETGFGIGSYPFIVVERNPGDKLDHKFQSAAPVSLFSAADGNHDCILTGTVRYADAQEALLGYVMTAPEEYKNEDLEGLLIYYFCLVLEAFKQEGIELRTIAEEDIDALEEPFFDMLDQYFESEDEEIIESFCDQPFLAQFMAMEVSEEDEDGSELSEETATQLFIVSLAMISLLNRAIIA